MPSTHIEQPWVEKYRPRILDEVVGQKHIIKPLKTFIHTDSIPHLLLAGPAGVGKCLEKNSIIVTSTGKVTTIENLFNEHKDDMESISETENVIPNPNVSVSSFDGKKQVIQKVGYIYRQKINEPTITIKTKSGRSLTTTMNHKYYCFDSTKGGVWKKAITLKNSDCIAIPCNIDFISKPLLEYKPIENEYYNYNPDGTLTIKRSIVNNYTQKGINIPEIVGKKFFEFMGWLVSEGCEFGEVYQRGCINFTQFDHNVLNHFANLSKELFNVNPKIESKDNRVRIHSLSLSEFLRDIGYSFGKKAPFKSFPDFILTAPLDVMNCALRSFFDGDGYFDKYKVCVSSSSKILIHQLYYMLLRNGIVSSYSERIVGKKIGLANKHYILKISTISHLKTFVSKIGFSLERKIKPLKEYISSTKKEPVFNYGMKIDKKLFREMRHILHLESKEVVGVSSGVEKRGTIGRTNLIKSFNVFIEKICRAINIKENVNQITNWNEFKILIKSLNIPLRDISREIGCEIHKLYNAMKGFSELIYLEKSKESLIDLLNKMIGLQPLINKMQNDLVENYYDQIKSIKINDPKEQFVYDLNVPVTHNFIAGEGILVHNTTAALAFIREMQRNQMRRGFTYLELNASEARGIKTIRTEVKQFVKKKSIGVKLRFVILDECDSMTASAQQALRGIMEGINVVDTRFILICNYSNKIITPIQSRCSLQRFHGLNEEQIKNRLMYISMNESLILDDDVVNTLIYISEGDVRRAVNYLQAISNLGDEITPQVVYQISGRIDPINIQNMLMTAYEKNLEKSSKILDSLFNEYGLSASNILKQCHSEILNLEVSELVKLEMLGILPDYEYRISSGATEEIQMRSMLVQFSEINA